MSGSTVYSSHPNNFLSRFNEKIHGKHIDKHPLTAKVQAMILIIIGVGLLYASLPLSLSIGSVALAFCGGVFIAKSIGLITLIVQRALCSKSVEEGVEMNIVSQPTVPQKDLSVSAPPFTSTGIIPTPPPEVEQLKNTKRHMGEIPQPFLERFQPVIEALPEEPVNRFDCWMKMYNESYVPPGEIFDYMEEEGYYPFARDCAAVRVYYNPVKMTHGDALRHLAQREPTNIDMNCDDAGQPKVVFNEQELRLLYKYEVSAHRDPEATRERDGHTCLTDSSVVCVYTPTFVEKKPGQVSKTKGLASRIGVLSVAAPALDKPQQPDFAYYITGKVEEEDRSAGFSKKTEKGILDRKKYEEAMQFLAKVVVQCLIEQVFTGRGDIHFKRLVLTRYGQGNFLKAIRKEDLPVAHAIFYQSLVNEFISRAQTCPGLRDFSIVMSEYNGLFDDEMRNQFVFPLREKGFTQVGIINGDILDNAQQGDLIVNPWDPHSAYGNGNKGDRSFDGFMGSATTALATTLPWINTLLLWNRKQFVPIGREADPSAAASSGQS